MVRFFYGLVIFCLLVPGSGYGQPVKQMDLLTLKADSLHANGDYELAFELRKQALQKFSSDNSDYTAYLQAKRYLTESCMYEKRAYNYHNPKDSISKQAYENYFRLAIEKSRQAKKSYEKVKNPNKVFLYDIHSRIYHQLGFTGKWRLALTEAQSGLKVLRDTLSKTDKKFVDLIHDIGFIYAEIGDYSKAIENYKASLDLYIASIGENTTDVALSYNNIGAQYRKLGLRKDELSYLLKAKNIWEKLNNDADTGHLYVCYGNLFTWYSYYGDFEKAEEYLLKRKLIREKIKKNPSVSFINNHEDKYKDQLREWYDLMLHYSRKKDTAQTLHYANAIAAKVKPGKKMLNFEVDLISRALEFEASILRRKQPGLALEKIDQAIQIQKAYQQQFYTKVYPYELYKAEVLADANRFAEAGLLFTALDAVKDEMTLQERFKLSILKAKSAQASGKIKDAAFLYDAAFGLLAVSNVSDLETLSVADLKPLISFETIDGFIAMGDFYLNLHKAKAMHRYMLASKIYNQLYLGERYNERLFQTNNEINERLFLCLSADQSIDLTDVVNSIENNASKLIWFRFLFNNKRLKIKVPESQLNREERLVAELNFYQNKILESGREAGEKITVWKSKVYDLKNELSKLQELIARQNTNYHRFNSKAFDVKLLQKDLKPNEAILKYHLTDKNGYAFLISNRKIAFVKINDKQTILDQVHKCLRMLKEREPDYRHDFSKLKAMLFRDIAYLEFDKLTIIPDGSLHYLPFEVVLSDKKDPLISYASSLLLYQEQRKSKPAFENVSIGAFSASAIGAKLPRISGEVQSVLGFFDGKAHVNAAKADFLKQANQYNVLHLAMHSDINEEHPEFSALNFYNSKLFISELYNEMLVANLAVLSACDTGNGFYENGEGVISLSRAFNYAGIPSTVMSLWRVDDEATAKIMSYFYKHLAGGESKDSALRMAKQDYLKNTDDPLLKHPYYWSGFVISGNTDPLVERKFGRPWVLGAIGILAAVAVYNRKKLVQCLK